ncbi:MAG: GTP-binding protein [Candidatus Odinarchaeum yellowstonii]|uniref:GTP-binding protein n=1 Tax=Odinarchaeota yellowstonii (strain LCB_4) TaxID=1841599 RepID=A0AAF0IB81_ODILC|nr:MAG: GTP-binding protein [Candidatus Odinarchaeum yellowstonii]
MKILITGATRAGKSTLIRTLTNGKSISIDKHGTTVALDHGVITVRGIKLYLFGTPGLEHFSVLRKILSEGADGIIFVVDSEDRSKDNLARLVWREISSLAPGVPCIVAANKQDKPNARKPSELRKELSFLSGVPIIPTSAKDNFNLNVLMNAMLTILIGELSPLLKKIEKYSGVKGGIKKIMDEMKLDLAKIKSYLNWLEYRELIEVDWENEMYTMRKELRELLNTDNVPVF